MSDDLAAKIDNLTLMIDKDEKKFPSLLERSNLYQRQKNFRAAVSDIKSAMDIAEQRGRREELGKCHYRLGLVSYAQGNYANALAEINSAIEHNCKETTIEVWKNKILYEMKKTSGDKVAEKDAKPATEVPKEDTTTQAASTSIDAINKHAPLKVKIRDDWYQTNDSVVITIFAKNIKEADLETSFNKRGLHVSFPTGTGSEYTYNLEPLYDDIDAEHSTYRVFSTKLEITLKKATSHKWPTLEASDMAAKKYDTPSADAPLSYPTSSKKAINWSDFKLEEDDTEEKNENEFFSQLYANTDDDSRRAMMKSYVESNGTVLTTNWDEAKAKTFDTSPPEGMEPKQWSR